jgi:cellulose synthase/poly-beta-1,6-N-acetylglucosamine synthase-like glycosyltransferase/glycosyltransferase involved in cell wall biosynthesis/O-antigen/teichoic acid export membrane protein
LLAKGVFFHCFFREAFHMDSTNLSLVIPVLNEKENIRPLVERLDRALKKAGIVYELIFIDDHSTDGTWELLQSLAEQYPILARTKQGKAGKAYSLLEGFRLARYDLLGMIDGDLQYPPEALPDMIKKFNAGADVVVANRSVHKENHMRRFLSRGFSFVFTRLLHGLAFDTQSGLKVFRRQVFLETTLHPEAWTFDLEFLIQARYNRYKIVGHHIVFEERHAGESKINVWKATLEIGWNAVRLKFRAIHPQRIPALSNASMLGAGLSYKGRRFVTHTTLSHRTSAIQTFRSWQKVFGAAVLAATALGFFVNPLRTGIILVAALSTIYFIDVFFNLFLVTRSLKSPPEINFSREQLAEIDEKNLPMYTILCPLYREAHVLPGFLESLDRISWPKTKLDVLLLLEEDDRETILAATNLNLPSYVRALVVPHSMPKTKPKACNYGLGFARGEYLVVYDAEDVPDPMQLKKAYLGFQNLPENVKCLQAKLNYYNPHDNLLTRLFTAEYSLWFDVILTGLQSINAYIPLGGTSNHFRTRDLRILQGWDPFNVTEDCDLGVRIFKQGYKTAIIDSTTFEEANNNWHNWLRQRSRWIKGYIQTYLVHMRRPVEFVRSNGIQAFVFQLVVGGKIAFLLINPILWLATISYFTLRPIVGPTFQALYPDTILYIAVTSLVFGNFLFLYYYMIGAAKRQQWSLIKYVYLVPVYWLMASAASTVAIYQLFVKPHYWEKTRHGLRVKKSLDITIPIPAPAQPATVRPTISARLSGRLQRFVPSSLRPTLFSGVGLLMGAIMAANFFNFLFNAFLGRELGFEELGIVTLVSTLLSLAALFFAALGSTVNERTAYLYAAQGYEKAYSFTRFVRKGTLLVTAGASLLWIACVPFLAAFFRLPSQVILFAFTPILSLGALGSVNRGLLNGTLVFRRVAYIYIGEAVSKFILAVLMIFVGWHSWIYFSIPISIAFSAWLSERMVGESAGATQRSRVARGEFPAYFFAASLLTVVSSIIFLNLDIVLVKHFLSPQFAGQYSLLSLVGKMIYFFGSLPTIFMITFVSRAGGLKESSVKTFRLILGVTLGLTSIGVLFLGPLGRIVVPLLLGSKTFAILPYLNIYVAAIAMFTLSNVIVTYHLARKQYIFPLAALGGSLLMLIGILISHDSIYEITHVIFGSSTIGLGVILLMHIFEDRAEYAKRALVDLLGVFMPLPHVQALAATKKRILIFNWRDTRHEYTGGAEVYVQEMAKRWVAEGNRVTIFCGNDGKSPRSEIVDGIEVVRRGGFYLVYFWAFFYYMLRFRGKYDVVIDCENGIPFFTPLYVKEPVYCVVHHIHQEIFRKYLSKPLAMVAMLLEKRLMPIVYQNTQFITVSESTRTEMETIGLVGAGIDIVHNGVDLTLHRPAAKSKTPTVLYVGRLKPYKSLDVLIRAFQTVSKQVPEAKLLIAGSGEQESWLKEFVRDLDMDKVIEFRGRVSDAEKVRLMQEAWVFANPSMMEGWGITTIEANACGTPTVAANVPGLRDSVQNPTTGFLVPHGNSNALADAVLEIIGNEKLRQEMGREATEWAKQFDWSKTSGTFFSIIAGSQEVFAERAYEVQKFD